MNFADYFVMVQDKAGQRMDKEAVRYFYDLGYGVMDTVIKLTYRRP